MKTKVFILISPLVAITILLVALPQIEPSKPWSNQELTTIKSLWLANLESLPRSRSNRVADNLQAAKFGQQLFFDPQFSKNGNVSCASCHQPERKFTDGIALAEGLRVGARNTMSIVGAAYSPWYFWDGRKDSLWSQALGPLENKLEHGGHRFQYALRLSLNSSYRGQYESLFGQFPDLSDEASVDEVFVNMGKSIAAYERKLLPGVSRFDNYVDHLMNQTMYPEDEVLNYDEIEGLRLFIGKGQCTNCHNGPLLSNFAFHNTGIFPRAGGLPDKGRVSGAILAKEDPFNCLSQYSDDKEKLCDELQFMKEGDELVGAQKTPSLRALVGTEPYMHAGQLTSLREVLEHYNTADGAIIGHNEAKPLNLSDKQLSQLEMFLKSLDAPINAKPEWLAAPEGISVSTGNLTQTSNAY